MAELFLVEAVNDALHVELARDDVGDGAGRGRRPRRRRLPRDGRAARALRREPLRRHAARGGRDPRRRGRALHGGLEAGLRDAVRRVLVSVPRPADHARRPLPLAHRREDGVPARRCACRTAAACARPSCTTTRPRRTTSTRPASRSRSRRRRRTRRGCSPRRSAIPIPSSSSSRSSSTAARSRRCPRASYVVPLGEARLAREGTDVTLVAYGAMVPVCERAADELEGEASVEVLDLRSLRPLDEDALLASAAKTGRVVIVQEAPRTAGFGAELAAILAEKAILDLRGPVLRVTGFDVPYPYWKIEDATCRRSSASSMPPGSSSSSEPSAHGSGSSAASRATGCATRRRGDAMKWDDPRVRVVKLAGASYRADALQDEAFAPGRRLALVARAGERARPERGRRLGRRAARCRRATSRPRSRRSCAATSRRSRCGSSAARTDGASACACCSRRRTRGSRSRAREGLVLAATTSRSRRSTPASSVAFQARNAGWNWDPVDVSRTPEGAGHALEGPFEVRGARAGQTLVVHIDEVTPRAGARRGPTARASTGGSTATGGASASAASARRRSSA